MSNEDKFDKIIGHLESELMNLRTGRAVPSLLENIIVEAYGAKSPMNQLATISVPEPQVLVVQPFDPGVLKEIEKSIRDSGLDLNPIVDSKLIRINFPPLTEEKRKELVKVMSQKVEDAKIGIKKVREEFIKKIRQAEKDKEISEDEKQSQEKELQKTVDKYQDDCKAIADKKEKELLTV